MTTDITLKRLTGPAIEPYLTALARLRIEVFREFPYLYNGSMAYEEKYLRTYSRSPESLFVLALAGDAVIGAATGVPMAHETDEFKQPFVARGFDPEKIFYFGESVLQQPWRGQGIGVRFFEEREAYARELGRFELTAFCAVERPANHPRCPAGYTPLDRFWAKRGYAKQPELVTTYNWQDLDETSESPKPMVFWLKKLAG
ncbi:MAG: GNAT family N-acetyltransferase [Anaerolineae bacterium]